MTSDGGPASTTISVKTRDGMYPVVVEAGALDNLPAFLVDHAPARRYAVVSDSNVAPLHGERAMERCRAAGLDASLFTFPAGEASKSRKSWSILTDEMLEAGFARDSCVVAVGGGVTTDLAGFVAATYLRGVPVVQVPTSYLAMIDASVGGKTGVDVKAGKNLVGAFHPPRLVVADPALLATLPREERAQGIVEAVKHGAILDAAYFGDLRKSIPDLLEASSDWAGSAVLRSVELKAHVVSEDEFEGGFRQILNFGHTVGHALEAASSFALGHGSAVALGMLLEAEIGERLGVSAHGTRAELADALGRLLGALSHDIDPDVVIPYLWTDKKVRGGRIRMVLLERVGRVDRGSEWSHEVSEELVAEVLRAGI